MLDPRVLRTLVAEASLAPSVHNIQPTRWRPEDGRVVVTADPARRLPIGDPEGRDVAVSHGCAVEGFRIAAASQGLAVEVAPDGSDVAVLTLKGVAEVDPLAAFVGARRTYRGRFEASPSARDACARLAETCPDLVMLQEQEAIADLAALYDDASLRWFRRADYRAELVSWMRLSRRHADWARDGLNAEAMAMSPFEAAGAGFVLGPGVFEALDKVGLARALVAEAPIVRSATAVALFHRPADEPPFETGRRFYRVWLAFTQAGLSASPMAVLADDEAASASLRAEHGLGLDRRLITAFRLGLAPASRQPPKPRLPLESLILL
jgi:nitroreductase